MLLISSHNNVKPHPPGAVKILTIYQTKMSILMTPYEKTERNGDSKEETLEDLMIFGYHCKLYRDDVKAELENGGSFLIPWVGDSSLMIDR